MNNQWYESTDFYYCNRIPKYNFDEIILSSSSIPHVLQLFDKTMEGYLTRQQFADKLVFKIKENFSDERRRFMSSGVKNESIVFSDYSDYIISEYPNDKVIVTSPFLCRPKFDTRLSCKSDGLIYINDKLNGLLEIKTTHSYKRINKLQEIIDKSNNENYDVETLDEVDSDGIHKFIESYHYAQIQFSLQCHNIDWCDYILSYPSQNKNILWRIKKNDNYWNEFVYPSITSFFDFEIVNSKRNREKK